MMVGLAIRPLKEISFIDNYKFLTIYLFNSNNT